VLGVAEAIATGAALGDEFDEVSVRVADLLVVEPAAFVATQTYVPTACGLA
jgi:hypothetical protein